MTAKALNVDFPAEIFDVQVNIPLIHQVVVAQQAAARQGTADTKSRGEVRGGGRKPYKQKGTGRARQGSVRAPQFAGGGTVHGPTPRGYDQRTPKKMKAAALRGALSDRARAGRVQVVESFVGGDRPSTKSAIAALAGLTSTERQSRRGPRTLVVLERGDDLTWLSLRNVDTVHLLAVDQLNTYDVLLCDDVVFTKGAYDAFVGGREAGSEPAQPAEVKSTDAEATEPEATEPETADTATEPESDESSEEEAK
jgi:large subunit ribosomal protein L4